MEKKSRFKELFKKATKSVVLLLNTLAQGASRVANSLGGKEMNQSDSTFLKMIRKLNIFR